MRKKIILFAVLFFSAAFSFAKKTPVKNLYQWTLPNGLTLFVAENHSVPLTYIEIAVKCGSFTQSEETSGLFHLYEHMMFKGNSLYKDAASVQRALSDMGVASWNGTTGVECVNYFFTVPSDLTEKGLSFWNAAIRQPLLDEKEFENEKKVVISEVQGNLSDTGNLYRFAFQKYLFPDAPWKLDPGGSIESVRNATIQKLKEIQEKYYIPNNTAVFVGGDVNPKEVYKMVLKIFGDWKKGVDPFENGIFCHDKNPVKQKTRLVLPYSQISSKMSQLYVVYRGADTAFERKDTYVSDGLASILRDPKSIYSKLLINDEKLGILDSDYFGILIPTYRQCGNITFSILLPNSLDDFENKDIIMQGNVVQSAGNGSVENQFENVVKSKKDEKNKNLSNFSNNLSKRCEYFIQNLPFWVYQTAMETAIAKQVTFRQLSDEREFEIETSTGLLNVLRYYWICADEDYYFKYIDQMVEITNDDLKKFVDEYIKSKEPLVILLINPEVYKENKKYFDDEGYKEIKREDVVWFESQKSSVK